MLLTLYFFNYNLLVYSNLLRLLLACFLLTNGLSVHLMNLNRLSFLR